MTTKQISVSEFRAHFAEKLRVVETEDCALEITRHGKIIAVVEKPRSKKPDLPKGWPDYLGKLSGTAKFSENYDPAEPAWSEDEWEMNRKTDSWAKVISWILTKAWSQYRITYADLSLIISTVTTRVLLLE